MKNISIILPVMDETVSLKKTVEVILEENKERILEFVIMISPKTKQESRNTIIELEKQYPGLIKTFTQTLPFLGGAMRDSFTHLRGDWAVMMASDLETDPHTVKDLIHEADSEKWDIVTATRWVGKNNFSGYSPIKLVLNFIFQKFFQILYFTRLTDLTYGFRILRTEILKKIKWEEVRHPFLLETVLKPLRLHYRIGEVSTSWSARGEGESHNSFFRNFVYFRIGFKTRFAKKSHFLGS